VPEIHREQHRCRRIDRHRRRDRSEVDAVEERFHVGERGDVHSALTDLTERQLVIRISAHQRRQVEGDAQPSTTRLEQLLVPPVRFFGRPEPGKLPHRPKLAAVPRRMNSTRVRESARVREVALVVQRRDILRRVELIDRPPRDGGEASPPLF
jgi:hypothetical protein